MFLTGLTCPSGRYLPVSECVSDASDGMWGPWKMISKKGESGVWWRAEQQPAYQLFKGVQGLVGNVAGGAGGLFKKIKR